MPCYFRRCSQERKLVMRWRVVFTSIEKKKELCWWGKPWNQSQGLPDTNSFHLIPKQKEQPTWAVWNNVGWSRAAQLTPVLLWRCLLKWIFSETTLIILDLKSSVTSKFICFVFMSLSSKSCYNNRVRESRWKVHTTCDDRWAKKSPRQLKGDTFGSPKRSQEWKGFTFPQEVHRQFLSATKCSVFGKWQ